MKGCIENSHLRHFGQSVLCGKNTFEMSGIVQWRQVFILFPFFEYFRRQFQTLRKFASVSNTMAYGVNFIQKPFSRQDLAAKIRDVLDAPARGGS